jgi:putative hydrolase of the HAD superfamily
MRKFDAVTFDLDGTLYPDRRLYIKVFPVLKDLPFMTAFNKARKMLRNNADAGKTSENDSFYDAQARIMADFLGQDAGLVKDKLEKRIYRGFEPHFKTIKLFPFVKETLAALQKAGVLLGILSDFPLETKLANLGLAHIWDAVVESEAVGALKPHTLAFKRLTDELGAEPQRILYVGNSVRYDVEGAHRAGMTAALKTSALGVVVNKGKKKAEFVFADYRKLLNYMIQ